MKPFARRALVVLSLCSAPVLAAPPHKPALEASEQTLTVRAGNAKTLKAKGVTRLALGDPEIADVTIAGGDVIRINGLKAGETKLLVWTGQARKEYRIVVEK